MSEIITKSNIKREKGFLYYIGKDGNIWSIQRGKKGGKKIFDSNIKREHGYLYFINKDGNVARSKIVRRTKK